MKNTENKTAIALWLAVLLLALGVIAKTRFTADFSAFLPVAPTAQQRLLVDQLQNGVVSRLILLAIEGGDIEARSAASPQLAALLRGDRAFAAINNGEALAQQRDQQLLFAHRYLLSPAVSAQHFSVDGLREAIGDSVDMLASPAGLMLKNWIEQDPTGEMMRLLEQWNPAQQPLKHNGVWVSRDRQRALLLVQTTAAGADTDAQYHAVARIRAAFAQVQAGLPGAGKNLRLILSGPAVFALDARESIRTQSEYLAALSLFCIVIFLWSIYRSTRLLLLGLVPVAAGIALAIAAVSLRFGSVHGLTLAFGTTLIGEAVDYAIYFFVQGQGAERAAWRREYWPTVRLGVIISACGFATLLFSGFPGLAQLGLYSIVGVAVAALTARFILPLLTPPSLQVRSAQGLGNRLLALLAQRRPFARALVVLLGAAAAAVVAQRGAAIWDEALTALSPVPAAAQQRDAQLRADLGAPDVRYMLTIAGVDEESALQGAERAAAVVQALSDGGAIAGFDTPSRYLPSRAVQLARQAALPAPGDLQPRLRQALRGLPLDGDKLQDFVAAVDAARRGPLLQRADLDGSSFALAVDSLLIGRADGWHALLPLRANGGADIPAARLREALAAAGVADAVLIDITAETEQLYAGYFREALHFSLAGLAAIAIVIALGLRSLPRFIAVFAPLLAAVAVVMAAFVLAGQRLHLLHLIGLFLIVAVGSNYALFFARGELQPRTLASLFIANVTTVIGFGLLAFSSVPVLQAIGATVAPGAVLALIFSALWAAPESTRGTHR